MTKFYFMFIVFFMIGCNSDPLQIKFPKEVMTEFHCFIPKKNIEITESKNKKILTIINKTNESIKILCSHVMLVPEFGRTPQINQWEDQIFPKSTIKLNLINDTTFYYYYTIKNKEEILFLGLYSYYKKQ